VSFSTSDGSSPAGCSLILRSFLQKPGSPFADVLSAEAIQAALDAHGVAFGQEDDAVYTPQLTLWAWLSQYLFKDEQRSCRAAVARLTVLLVALERKPCVLPGACQAAASRDSADGLR